MGCGSSSVPDVIIPDPQPGDKCHVLFKKTGMFARDQNVFKDCDKTQKWLMMDKEGSLFSNPTYTLENFVRAEGSKRGQCLCYGELEVTKVKIYGIKVKDESCSSASDSSDEEETTEIVKMKWKQVVKAKYYSDKSKSTLLAAMKVSAKGKAKKVTTTTTYEDEEGNEREKTDIDITKKVNKVKYEITECKGEDELPVVNLKGKPNKSAEKLEWSGPLFQAEIGSNGWGSQEIEIKTDWKNPALGMLMGYVTAKEISPDDIKDNVVVW
eukprot:CAMPEP_0175113122 /NCGR_PEP_ID=MMETSP0086_2-20121207/15952_1 /TAXON_ID=136419 /ORGANISM="Unknown Unknown, Strain D1" /LENGTH=267 /DNA_ID=CAMNT_0016392279 /DNA_START=8 /DNA_END=811 /DNA_ORIENTATION=+